MKWKRESRFTRKFGPDTPWGGHKRYALTPRQTIITVMGIVATMLVCVTMLIVAAQIKVKSVEVKGNRLYSADWIKQTCGIEAGGGYFDFDPSTLEDKMLKDLPLLRDIQISRKWDGRVELTITEESGFYYVRHNQNYYLLSDETLRVIAVAADSGEYRKLGAVYLGLPREARLRVGETLRFEYLPYQDNETGTQQANEGETRSAEKQFAYVAKMLETYRKSELFGKTKGIDLSDSYDVYAILDSKVKISFGTSDNLGEKIKSAVLVLKEEGRYDAAEDEQLIHAVIDVEDSSHVGFRESVSIPWPDWASD